MAVQRLTDPEEIRRALVIEEEHGRSRPDLDMARFRDAVVDAASHGWVWVDWDSDQRRTVAMGATDEGLQASQQLTDEADDLAGRANRYRIWRDIEEGR